MTTQSDDRSPNAVARATRGRLRAIVAIPLAFVAAVTFGFVAFLSQLRNTETTPARQADGIVVLTGGSSRVSDAMELLAAGYGKRLLISGVHPASTASDISRTDVSRPVKESHSLFNCCVDLDRSAVSTRSNASETRRWAHERGFKSLIVVTSNYHMPRAVLEMSHAMPDVALIPYAVVGERWREEPWWENGATFRLVLSEYLKYIAAGLRVRLAELGIDVPVESFEQPTGSLPAHRPATADAN